MGSCLIRYAFDPDQRLRRQAMSEQVLFLPDRIEYLMQGFVVSNHAAPVAFVSERVRCILIFGFRIAAVNQFPPDRVVVAEGAWQEPITHLLGLLFAQSVV